MAVSSRQAPAQAPAQAPGQPAAQRTFHLPSFVLGVLIGLIAAGAALLVLRWRSAPAITLYAAPTPAAGAIATPAQPTALPKHAPLVEPTAAPATALPAATQPAAPAALATAAAPQVTAAAPATPAALTSASRSSAVAPSTSGGLIDINTATVEQLDQLPGIGASKAKAIIAGRPYASVDDLDRVPGIGAATLERLRPLVTVGR